MVDVLFFFHVLKCTNSSRPHVILLHEVLSFPAERVKLLGIWLNLLPSFSSTFVVQYGKVLARARISQVASVRQWFDGVLVFPLGE